MEARPARHQESRQCAGASEAPQAPSHPGDACSRSKKADRHGHDAARVGRGHRPTIVFLKRSEHPDGAHGENSLSRPGDHGQSDGQAPARGGLPADGLEPHGVTRRGAPGGGRQRGDESGRGSSGSRRRYHHARRSDRGAGGHRRYRSASATRDHPDRGLHHRPAGTQGGSRPATRRRRAGRRAGHGQRGPSCLWAAGGAGWRESHEGPAHSGGIRHRNGVRRGRPWSGAQRLS